MFAAAVALALILLFVVIYLCLKQKRRGKAKDFMTSEKNAPKLKMLEVSLFYLIYFHVVK